MMDRLQRWLAARMNAVRVNEVRRAGMDGRPVFIKRRRWYGSVVICCGNVFLKVARSGICMFVRRAAWIEWELHCARLLYPEREVRVGPGQALSVPEIRGTSLRQLLNSRQSVDAAFLAAARELRRVHQLSCSHYRACWSHGDLHLDNILYDADADRALFIDFDTRHEFPRSKIQRHSDDLRVVLLELMGTLDEGWVQPATMFLVEYGEPFVLEALARQLTIPRGFAKLFWFTRTNSCSPQQMQPKLQQLREILGRIIARSDSVELDSASPCSIRGESR